MCTWFVRCVAVLWLRAGDLKYTIPGTNFEVGNSTLIANYDEGAMDITVEGQFCELSYKEIHANIIYIMIHIV